MFRGFYEQQPSLEPIIIELLTLLPVTFVQTCCRQNLPFYVSFPSTEDILCVDGIHVLSRALNVLQCLLLSPHTSYQTTYLASHFQPAPHPKAEFLPLDLVPFEIIIPGAINPAQIPTIWGQTFHLAMFTLHYWTYSGSTTSLVNRKNIVLLVELIAIL